jgi:hypothetical protein
MTFQGIIAVSLAVLAALYFLRGAYQDLAGTHQAEGGSCGKCSSGGCPVAHKG